MGKTLLTPKDIVRIRAGNKCEKCGVTLSKNVSGIPDGITARSIHHRQPRRDGGKDSVICLVNLCIGCHRGIHADENSALAGGWIVFGRSPGRVPFHGWRGWVLPDTEGGMMLLDFDTGRAVPFSDAPTVTPTPRARKRVAEKPQYDRRRKSRNIAKVA